jgi:hypothetical protein
MIEYENLAKFNQLFVDELGVALLRIKFWHLDDMTAHKRALADKLHATELSLPISLGHTPDEVGRVCQVLADFVAA